MEPKQLINKAVAVANKLTDLLESDRQQCFNYMREVRSAESIEFRALVAYTLGHLETVQLERYANGIHAAVAAFDRYLESTQPTSIARELLLSQELEEPLLETLYIDNWSGVPLRQKNGAFYTDHQRAAHDHLMSLLPEDRLLIAQNIVQSAILKQDAMREALAV